MQVADVLMIDVNKVVFSENGSCYNGKKLVVYCRLSSRWENDHTGFYQDNKQYISLWFISVRQKLSLCNVIQCFLGTRVGALLSKHLR